MTTNVLTIKLKNISKVLNALLIFLVVLDPTNTILHLKNPVFILFCLTSLSNIKLKYCYVPFICFIVYFFSFLFGIYFDNNIDMNMAMSILKSILFFVYILFMDIDGFKSFKCFYSAILVMSIIEILVYIGLCLSSRLEFFLYQFFLRKEHFIVVSRRLYYGHNFFQVFYKTSPMAILGLCVSLGVYSKTFIKRYLYHSAVFGLCLFCSGTRANWLAALLIIGFIVLFYLFYERENINFVGSTLVLFSVCILFVIYFLLTTQEYSTNVKQEHFSSYVQLFSNNLYKFLTFGFGPGSVFYTTGFQGFYSVTELSYMDLLKNFGLIGTLSMLTLFSVPVFYLYKNGFYDNFLRAALVIGYLGYMFVAGTNPLLISSTGVITICFMFYISNKNLYEEILSDRKRVLFSKYLKCSIV